MPNSTHFSIRKQDNYGSNWETVTLCFSESFESLGGGYCRMRYGNREACRKNIGVTVGRGGHFET